MRWILDSGFPSQMYQHLYFVISKCNLSKSRLVLLVDLSTKWVPLHTIRVGVGYKQLVPHAGVKIVAALWHRTEDGTCTLGRSWVKIFQMCDLSLKSDVTVLLRHCRL